MFDPMDRHGADFEVYRRTDDGIEEIGSVTRFNLYMREPFWQAVSPDGDIYRPFRTKTLAAQALTRKSTNESPVVQDTSSAVKDD